MEPQIRISEKATIPLSWFYAMVKFPHTWENHKPTAEVGIESLVNFHLTEKPTILRRKETGIWRWKSNRRPYGWIENTETYLSDDGYTETDINQGPIGVAEPRVRSPGLVPLLKIEDYSILEIDCSPTLVPTEDLGQIVFKKGILPLASQCGPNLMLQLGYQAIEHEGIPILYYQPIKPI